MQHNMETCEYCHLKIYLAIAISEIKINIPEKVTFIFLKTNNACL